MLQQLLLHSEAKQPSVYFDKNILHVLAHKPYSVLTISVQKVKWSVIFPLLVVYTGTIYLLNELISMKNSLFDVWLCEANCFVLKC